MVWSTGFFLLLVIATLTSTISLHEVATAYFHEEWHLSRKAAASATPLLVGTIGILASLSVGVLNGWRIAGLNLFDALDALTANILMPLGGLFTSLFVGWRLDCRTFDEQLTNRGRLRFRIRGVLIFLLRYLCPLVLLAIFLDNLGVFKGL